MINSNMVEQSNAVDCDDVDIIMKDGIDVGYGYIYESAGNQHEYGGSMYLNRLNNELVQTGSMVDIVEDLANTSKSYCVDKNTKLDAINEVLGFYFLKPITTIPTIEKKTFKEAVDILQNSKLDYYIFKAI